MAAIEQRLGNVEDGLTTVQGRLETVENRLTTVEDRLTTVEGRLSGVEDRLTTVEGRLGTIEQDVSYLKGYIEHLATKAEVAEIKIAVSGTEIAMSEMKEELVTQLTWRMFGMIVGTFVVVASAVAVSQSVFN